MKAVIEVGVRGGAHTDNVILPSARIAVTLASRLVMVLTNDPMHPAASPGAWKINKRHPRDKWQSATHFVSISLLDGVERGPAAAALWRKPNEGEYTSPLTDSSSYVSATDR